MSNVRNIFWSDQMLYPLLKWNKNLQGRGRKKCVPWEWAQKTSGTKLISNTSNNNYGMIYIIYKCTKNIIPLSINKNEESTHHGSFFRKNKALCLVHIFRPFTLELTSWLRGKLHVNNQWQWLEWSKHF